MNNLTELFSIGIDVGGTFTDFLVTEGDKKPEIFKVLSTPDDPSIGLLQGLESIARSKNLTLNEFAQKIKTIVHGTTVTTNAVLTGQGAKTGLITTFGVRDALEMRRGIREEQYNNRYKNVIPLIPRHLRIPVRGRLNYKGEVLEELNGDDIARAIRILKDEKVESIAICYMNSFANGKHEQQTAELVRSELSDIHLSVSSELLPSIRFYDRLSTTALNAFVDPLLSRYIDQLLIRLEEIKFAGTLLIMQSNGGVMSPQVAKECPAKTLLSGPAAGPEAGLSYVAPHGYNDCLTVDMGGTSFDAALVRNGTAVVINEGEISRHRIALPMLDIVTIGAGGGSIARIDDGGLLRMGPSSAGAKPGPICYDLGGELPTCTDANLVLGYLDADFFAGGKMPLNIEKAKTAIEKQIAAPLGLDLEAAAGGMYRVINTNMAQGVREISIKKGIDPRDFPMVVAGGAGPLHACMICNELDIPMFLVPRESSIFCAAGMLMSDLRHDFVTSFVSPFESINWQDFSAAVNAMREEGEKLLIQENIHKQHRKYILKLDCRYKKQFHEVSFSIPTDFTENNREEIAKAFHREHKRLYGHSLEEQGTSIELINIRLRAVGKTAKLTHPVTSQKSHDASVALKSERVIYLPEKRTSQLVSIYDGHKICYGNKIKGPALIEQTNTTLLVTSSYDLICDQYQSFIVYQRESEERLVPKLKEIIR